MPRIQVCQDALDSAVVGAGNGRVDAEAVVPVHAERRVASSLPFRMGRLGDSQHQTERLRQRGEVLAEVPIGRVAGANLGEEPQRLFAARIDRDGDEEEGQDGGGHGGRDDSAVSPYPAPPL